MGETDNNNGDAEVLFPDRDLTLSTGEQVTVREFRFLEGLTVEQEARPLLESLQAAGESGDVAPIDILDRLLTDHRDLLMRLIGRSCDRDPEWFETLGDADGTTLMLAFWEVNSRFFMRRLLVRWTMRNLGEIAATRSGSDASSPPSSPTATPGASSADIPGDS